MKPKVAWVNLAFSKTLKDIGREWFVFARKNAVSNYEATLKGASASMMGIPILQLIPFHPLSNHVRHDCHGHAVVMVRISPGHRWCLNPLIARLTCMSLHTG